MVFHLRPPFLKPSSKQDSFLLSWVIGLLLFSMTAYAQKDLPEKYVAPSAQPRVGRDAAAKYFQKREVASAGNSAASGDHYLALMFGKIMSSQAYEWGTGSGIDNGDWDANITYRVSEWNNSMDFSVRINFMQFKFPEDNPLKMSIMPVLTFPDASSRFPLYFGGGIGPGVFFKQLPSKSSLSLDYQLIIGARFLDIFENGGIIIETGLKNHLHVLTSGQFNGTFLNAGAVFTF